jgi:hypothetical protein
MKESTKGEHSSRYNRHSIKQKRKTTMNTPTAEQMVQVHTRTREIGARLKSDAAHRIRYLADPISTLIDWGLPPDAAQELAAKITREQSQDEVSGYAYDSDGTYYHDMLDDYGIHINWGF